VRRNAPEHGPTRLVEVALPLPMPRTFTYRADRPLAPGTRVEVPFGPRRLVGWVVGDSEQADHDRIRPIRAVLEDSPSADAELLGLARWIGDYYLSSLGLVLRTALPNPLSAAGGDRVKTRRVLRLTRELPTLTLRDQLFGRAERQRECFEFVEAAGGTAPVSQLVEQGFSHAVLRGLVDRAVAAVEDEEVHRDPFANLPAIEGDVPPLTSAQAAALGPLQAAARGRGGTFLLRGVTGSGKTRVYIELLEEVVRKQGRGAIVLVPEIALTPQTVDRFRARFGDDVAVLHSALSDGERYDAWRRLRDGDRRIAVGARSAVFAPVRDLGVIVVDEEHESSYKQGEAPRYHAREVAIMRARMAGAVCLLGSATPALESWANAGRGKFTLLELPDRVEGRPLPRVDVVDLRKDVGGSGTTTDTGRASTPRVLSEPLDQAIRDRLEREEQVILLLNRRGYASFVQCRSCGHVWQCGRCNVSLTYHRTRRRLICHYCFHEEPPPTRCTECGHDPVAFRGLGTEQVERIVAEAYPEARIARMDVDTTAARWAHHEILGRVGRREVDILLGTQMIAKGLDFHTVTLVGVINADVGLNLPDFRAGERTFQLLTQVAGRAGRGSRAGQVIIQTAAPNHHAIQCALGHDYTGYAERELRDRQEPAYPPYARLANVVVSGPDELRVQEAVEALASDAGDALHSLRARDVGILGPAPCPIDRIRDRWRWHFLLRSPDAAQLGAVCQALYRQHGTGNDPVRVIIDRDPVALL
jgi:primosomal protein N' (replication factor Y) (superfamily II helicase)